MLSLAHSQKLSLVQKGYTVIHGAIAPLQIEATLKAINHWIGKGMPPEKMNEYWKHSFCPELRGQPVITELMNSGNVKQLMESVLGEGNVLPVPEGQIALRFPSFSDDRADSPGHVDGMFGPTAANPNGVLNNFTAVVGIQLSDQPYAGMGNLSVWPGSHTKVANYLKEHGPQSLYGGLPNIDYGQPIQLTAKAGDLVIMHYLLVHGVTVNHSPHVRYALYYRPKHKRHDAEFKEMMTDPWRHWEGLAEQAKLAATLPADISQTTTESAAPAMHTPLVSMPATPEHLKAEALNFVPKQAARAGGSTSPLQGSWLKRKLRAIVRA